MSERTAVYHLYDRADTLLYIGMTENPDSRFAHHESLKSWWPDVARKEIRWYDSREGAAAAEDEAIRTERALYNVARSPWAPKPRQLGEREITLTALRANLTEAAARVRIRREIVTIVDRTRERRPLAALIPVDVLDAAEAVGGPDVAVKILRAASASE